MQYVNIFNKNAGGFSQREVEKISRLMSAHPHNLQGKTVITSSISALEEELKSHSPPDILGLGGGDGTGSRTLTEVSKVWGEIPPYLALFAMGTINNIALPYGLSDGLADKVRKITGKGKTKSLSLAEYISDCAEKGRLFDTKQLSLLDINGKERKGFNIGFGLIPKLLWFYYGKTMEQYRRLEIKIENTKSQTPEAYQKILENIVAERNGLEDLIDRVTVGNENMMKKTGAVYALATTGNTFLNAFNPFSEQGTFLTEPIAAAFSFDGKERTFPKQPTAIYIATYEQANLGIKGFWPKPAPEARSQPGKMQVVVSWATPLQLALQLPKLFRGEHLENIKYIHAEEVRVEADRPVIGHVDADYIFGRSFTLRYDQELNIITPFA